MLWRFSARTDSSPASRTRSSSRLSLSFNLLFLFLSSICVHLRHLRTDSSVFPLLIILRSGSPSEELSNRPTVLDDRAGAADGVEVGGVERDAHVVVDGRREVGGGDRVVLAVAAVALGGADDLAVPEAAAGQGHRHDGVPVVAAVGAPLGPHHGGAPELAHGNDQGVIEQSALV